MAGFNFLSTEEFIAQQVELTPFFMRVKNHADGEITPVELMSRARKGSLLIGVMRKNDQPAFLIGFSVDIFPRKKVLRIMLAAGAQTEDFVKHFFHAIHFAAQKHGCVDIEARCRPSMARLVRRIGRNMALREFTTFRLPAIQQGNIQ